MQIDQGHGALIILKIWLDQKPYKAFFPGLKRRYPYLSVQPAASGLFLSETTSTVTAFPTNITVPFTSLPNVT
jgi:hypothetical protein